MSYQYNPLLLEGSVGKLINSKTAAKNNAGILSQISSSIKRKRARNRAASILKDLRKGKGSKEATGLLSTAGEALKQGDFKKSDAYRSMYKSYVRNPKKVARKTAKFWAEDPSKIDEIVNNTGYSVMH